MTATPPQRRWYTSWLRLIQVAGTLILSVVLARSVDWGQLAGLMRELRWGYIALAALLLLVTHLVNVVRWRWLLRPAAVPYRTLLNYYGAGLFSSNFLPTGIGGDGVRAALASRHVPAGRAVVSVALDRGLGLAVLFVFVLPGMWFGLPAGLLTAPAGWQRWAGPAALAALAGAGLAALLWRRVPRLRELAARLSRRWLALPAGEAEGWRFWAARLGGGAFCSFWAILCIVLAHIAFLGALGLPLSPGAAIWMVVLSSLSLLAPIAINGLGVMESVYILVLAGYGVGSGAALGVALLARLAIVGYSLLGGLLALRAGAPAPAYPPAAGQPGQ